LSTLSIARVSFTNVMWVLMEKLLIEYFFSLHTGGGCRDTNIFCNSALSSSEICKTTFFKRECLASCKICIPPAIPGPQEPAFPACVPVSLITEAPPASPEAAAVAILQEIQNQINDAITALQAQLLALSQPRSVFSKIMSLFTSRDAQNQNELTDTLGNINTAQGDIESFGAAGDIDIADVEAILTAVITFVNRLLALIDILDSSDIGAIQEVMVLKMK
jgi:hypothetical protein